MAKKSVPTQSPQEAGEIACGACGAILKAQPVLQFGKLDHVHYECKNETVGCNWFWDRVATPQGVIMQGIRADGTLKSL